MVVLNNEPEDLLKKFSVFNILRTNQMTYPTITHLDLWGGQFIGDDFVSLSLS